MRFKLETFAFKANERVGVFGGSFDPVHEGHVHVALTALQALQLDRVIVFVTPANPLKPQASADFQVRFAQTRQMFNHSRITVSDAEQKWGTHTTYDLVARLQDTAASTHFVWIMGGDNLHTFDKWYRWRELAARVPIAIVARGEQDADVLASAFTQAFAGARIAQADAGALASSAPPAWVYLSGPHVKISSSQIREGQDIAKKKE